MGDSKIELQGGFTAHAKYAVILCNNIQDL